MGGDGEVGPENASERSQALSVHCLQAAISRADRAAGVSKGSQIVKLDRELFVVPLKISNRFFRFVFSSWCITVDVGVCIVNQEVETVGANRKFAQRI